MEFFRKMLIVLVWYFIKSEKTGMELYFTSDEVQSLTDKQCVVVNFKYSDIQEKENG